MSEASQPDAGQAISAAHWLRSVLAPGARLTADSRDVRPGDGFIAYPGGRSDGRAFIEQALAGGAAAVLYEADEDGEDSRVSGDGGDGRVGGTSGVG
ncbi:MAG: Mur ligase domain-containing protein, partial [Burkholderiaceae bacterium]